MLPAAKNWEATPHNAIKYKMAVVCALKLYNKRRLSAGVAADAATPPARFALGRRLKRTHATEPGK